MQPLVQAISDPMTVRSVPHMRAYASKLKPWLNGTIMPSAVYALGVQVGDMLDDRALIQGCAVAAKAIERSARTPADHGLLALAQGYGGDFIDEPGHLGQYIAQMVGQRAYFANDAVTLKRCIERMDDDTGVPSKLMCPRFERLLLETAYFRLTKGELQVQGLWDAMRHLPAHFCQGAVLDCGYLFYGMRYGAA